MSFGLSSVPCGRSCLAANFIGAGLPVYDIRKYTGGYPSPVGCAHCISTPELGRALAEVIGNRGASLLFGHGIAVVEASLPALVSRAHDMRMNAVIQQMALSLGGTRQLPGRIAASASHAQSGGVGILEATGRRVTEVAELTRSHGISVAPCEPVPSLNLRDLDREIGSSEQLTGAWWAALTAGCTPSRDRPPRPNRARAVSSSPIRGRCWRRSSSRRLVERVHRPAEPDGERLNLAFIRRLYTQAHERAQ